MRWATMSEEAAFIAALVAEPSDRTAALVFADWLDERGDPRGAMLRIDEVAPGWHRSMKIHSPSCARRSKPGRE